MKLLQLIKRLENAVDKIREVGGDVEASEVALETRDNTDELYYENSFELFIDDRNDIGLSPVSK